MKHADLVELVGDIPTKGIIHDNYSSTILHYLQYYVTTFRHLATLEVSKGGSNTCLWNNNARRTARGMYLLYCSWTGYSWTGSLRSVKHCFTEYPVHNNVSYAVVS